MESKKLCTRCGMFPITNKKRGLCSRCYQKERKEKGPFLKGFGVFGEILLDPQTEKKRQNYREIEFIKNYFSDPKNFIHQPAIFNLNGRKYTPDFYDIVRNVFIEVSGSRQAYFQNKDKYAMFQKYFPQINFEVRSPSGEIINEHLSINGQIGN